MLKRHARHAFHLLSLALLFFVVTAGLIYSSRPKPTEAEEGDIQVAGSLYGNAWSSNIGWITFGTAENPMVAIGEDGSFSGYAWSSNVGWIRFYPDWLGYNGAAVGPDRHGAKLIEIDGLPYDDWEVRGWARACSVFSAGCHYEDLLRPTSETGGWDGWIKMSGDWSTGVERNANELSGFAWGSEVLGWISFAGVHVGAPPPPPPEFACTAVEAVGSQHPPISELLSGQWARWKVTVPEEGVIDYVNSLDPSHADTKIEWQINDGDNIDTITDDGSFPQNNSTNSNPVTITSSRQYDLVAPQTVQATVTVSLWQRTNPFWQNPPQFGWVPVSDSNPNEDGLQPVACDLDILSGNETVTLNLNVSGNGSITGDSSDNATVYCAGGDCGGTAIEEGSDVDLTASANDGSHFVNWGGDCVGTATGCSLTMNSNKSVTANFALDEVVGGGGATTIVGPSPEVVRISQQSDGIPTSSVPDAVYEIRAMMDDGITVNPTGDPAEVCVKSVVSKVNDQPIDPDISRCYLFQGNSADPNSGNECGGSNRAHVDLPANDELNFVVTIEDLDWQTLVNSPYEVTVGLCADDSANNSTLEFRYQPPNVQPE